MIAQKTPRSFSGTLEPLLAQLDEGIGIYRRHFVPFLLISLAWFVPVIIMFSLVIAFATWRGDSEAGVVIVIFGFMLLLVPLFIYLIGGLSRAAAAADAGRPVRFREAFAIGPLRALGMLVFTIVYYVLSQIVTSLVSFICICPLYLAGIFVSAGVASVSDDASVAAFGLMGIVFALVYLLLLAIGGASYSSLIYALQPWAQEQRSFGESMQLSIDLVAYRFGRNLLAWALSALLVAVVGLSVTLAIVAVLPLPLAYLLGEESPVTLAVTAAAWLIGLCVALPPLPIWMALLYRRNLAARTGSDLDAKVQAWSNKGMSAEC